VSTERIRVACTRCDAHRDISIAPRCLVCGAFIYKVVAPKQGDLDAITTELLAAAELVDVVIQDGSLSGINCEHPAALRLQAACRNLALARAGCLGY
jgi:hypothetical protein